MKNKTEEMLLKDSLYESERLLNKNHYSEFNEGERAFAFSKFILDNEQKKNYFKGLGDTYWGMKWNEFKSLITSYGFVKALEYDFDYEDKHIEEAILYYHPDKGLIIWATSYGDKDHINGGNLYGEIQANSKDDCQTIWRWLSTGGYIDGSDMVYETSHDVREGLFSKLNELETAGVFQNKWIKNDRFLYFLDYGKDKKHDGDNYREITQKKIEQCTQEFRDIISR